MTDGASDRWVPLSAREDAERRSSLDALHQDVPPWLHASLWGWCAQRVRIGSARDTVQQIERSLRFSSGMAFDDRADTMAAFGSSEVPALSALRQAVVADETLFLDVVDWLVSRMYVDHADYEDRGEALEEEEYYDSQLAQLDEILEQAGSMWTVDRTSTPRRLVRRVPAEIVAAAKQATSPDDRASEHLTKAWAATYGRRPAPSEAYSQAVKAVEAVAIPVVCPANPRPTLGRVVKDLQAKPSKWHVGLRHPNSDHAVVVVAEMCDLLWKGQADRHGSSAGPPAVSLAEAEAAVHLAATLVQWFRSGVVGSGTQEASTLDLGG
ncbi:MAG: hypothetical protein QOK43_1988 [Acidimicrobiaceae bacterium]|nr:hypothetical protein [Acidimicrobiaceae bacterium]